MLDKEPDIKADTKGSEARYESLGLMERCVPELVGTDPRQAA
jgi:hypothetical protein